MPMWLINILKPIFPQPMRDLCNMIVQQSAVISALTAEVAELERKLAEAEEEIDKAQDARQDAEDELEDFKELVEETYRFKRRGIF